MYPQYFLIPEISETLKGSFTKFFGTVRQKIFDGKLWYPLLCKKFFDAPNFLKHWRDAHESFRHCETKNFRRKIVIHPPLIHKFFPYQKFSETQNGSLAKFFRSCEIKKISTKPWSFPPPLLENFWYQNSFETQKCSTYFIGTVRQKFFNGI